MFVNEVEVGIHRLDSKRRMNADVEVVLRQFVFVADQSVIVSVVTSFVSSYCMSS